MKPARYRSQYQEVFMTSGHLSAPNPGEPEIRGQADHGFRGNRTAHQGHGTDPGHRGPRSSTAPRSRTPWPFGSRTSPSPSATTRPTTCSWKWRNDMTETITIALAGQPQLGQDHHVQRPDRFAAACGQLARRDRGTQVREDARWRGNPGHRGPSRGLLPDRVHRRGAGGPELPGGGTAPGGTQRCSTPEPWNATSTSRSSFWSSASPWCWS